MRSLKKLTAMTLLTAMTITLVIPAAAPKVSAKTKTISVKTKDYNKAKSLKKGKNLVKYKKANGYYKFTAPSAKTYKFVFSNVNALRKGDRRRNYVNGYMGFHRLDQYGYLTSEKVPTNGGTTYSLQIGSRKFVRSYNRYSTLPTVDRYRTSRYGKVYLNKGESIYISGFFAGVKKSNASFKVTVK